jgi:hypothetical protein
VGFNSEKCFIEVDENENVVNGIRVEVMELKPVVVKKAAKERTSGEGQSPFGRMVECDDFVDILHGERFTERGAPVDKIFLLQQPLGNKFFQIVEGAWLGLGNLVAFDGMQIESVVFSYSYRGVK